MHLLGFTKTMRRHSIYRPPPRVTCSVDFSLSIPRLEGGSPYAAGCHEGSWREVLMTKGSHDLSALSSDVLSDQRFDCAPVTAANRLNENETFDMSVSLGRSLAQALPSVLFQVPMFCQELESFGPELGQLAHER